MTSPLTKQILKTNACLSEINNMGPVGPVIGTVMLHNCALLGVRRTTRADRISIDYLWVSPSCRGEGVGSKVLNAVTTRATWYGQEIVLRPAEFNRRGGGMLTGMPLAKLRGWYEKHGFIEIDRGYMLWKPRDTVVSSRERAGQYRQRVAAWLL
jgi:ribosomal protein S18 acetylase RimI-like enzyme